DGSIPIYNDDPSLRFYKLSWNNENEMKEGSVKANFVTGYAMTDPFEDFAETYNYYILHGSQFKQMAKYDKTLRRKYIYIKYFVFEGQEFDYDPYNETVNGWRNYDSTLLNYDYETFLRSEGRKLATL
ncbi:putative zinc-binding metallopeptidase, partial [Patescibacteria group bacterium]